MLSRRQFALGAIGIAAPNFLRAQPAPQQRNLELTEVQLAAGRMFLQTYPSIDIHSHAGRFFLDATPATTRLAAEQAPSFLDKSLTAMRVGGLSAIVLNAVADHVILEAATGGLVASRPYAPGEAFADYGRQIGLLKAAVNRGQMTRGLTNRDIITANRSGKVACVFAVEGADFIEDRLERVAGAHADGVRAITIIHYNVNQVGDPQTSAPIHGGLSPIGKAIVREMNRKGVIVDLSHASFEATQQAVTVATRPMIISHSNIKRPGLEHPRLVTLEHARLVTRAGGVVGTLPGGVGMETFTAYIDNLLRAVDDLGIDHVAIGTDMDFTFRSVIDDYANWGTTPAALLAKGMHAPEVAKIMGGNFMRVMAAQT